MMLSPADGSADDNVQSVLFVCDPVPWESKRMRFWLL